MDADAILGALTHSEDLPKEALAAASAQRAEMVPLFLTVIDDYLAADSDARKKPVPLFFIFHLLGGWREKTAYRSLARFLRAPAEDVDHVLGDSITETSHRVMAAVFDGDPQPLYDIILDSAAEEYVRSRMCEALAMLALRGELDRDEASRFLREAFAALEPRESCYVWNGWQSAIAMLGLSEFKDLVKEAFDQGFVDESWLGFHHFERDLNDAIENPDRLRKSNDGPYTLFGDATEEFSTWYGFSDAYRKDRKRWQEASFEEPLMSEPYVNPFKGVGRNDLCPCGSGKKFKKCCLQ